MFSDEDYTRKIIPFLRDEYFHDSSERKLFSYMSAFINKYNSLPTIEAIEIAAQNDTSVNENDFKNLDDSYLFPRSPTGYGTFNFILSDYAERRFFIEGARFLLVNGMPKEQVRERMNLVLEFANTPNAGNLRLLRENGVGYFVVDKESTSIQNWKDFATTRYENETFLVLELL